MAARIDAAVPPVKEKRIGRIPVRNLWLLMLYASDLTRVRAFSTPWWMLILMICPTWWRASLRKRSNAVYGVTSLTAIVIAMWYSLGSVDVSMF